MRISAPSRVVPPIFPTCSRRSSDASRSPRGASVGGTGYGRVDMRIDAAGRPWILEVNANPDFAPTAGLARMARTAGIDYAAMVRLVCDEALAAARGVVRRSLGAQATTVGSRGGRVNEPPGFTVYRRPARAVSTIAHRGDSPEHGEFPRRRVAVALELFDASFAGEDYVSSERSSGTEMDDRAEALRAMRPRPAPVPGRSTATRPARVCLLRPDDGHRPNLRPLLDRRRPRRAGNGLRFRLARRGRTQTGSAARSDVGHRNIVPIRLHRRRGASISGAATSKRLAFASSTRLKTIGSSSPNGCR